MSVREKSNNHVNGTKQPEYRTGEGIKVLQTDSKRNSLLFRGLRRIRTRLPFLSISTIYLGLDSSSRRLHNCPTPYSIFLDPH